MLVEIASGSDGYQARPKFVAGNSYDWPKPVAKMVLRAYENDLTLFEFNRLNYLAGVQRPPSTK